MYRFCKIVNDITCTAQRTVRLEGWYRLTTAQRLFSNKGGKTPQNSDSKECSADSGDFCKQPPVDCNLPGQKRLPVFKDCPTPNAMDDLPKPQCPYKEHDNKQKKSYFKVLVVGTIVMLISVAAVIKSKSPSTKKAKPKNQRRIKPVVKLPSKSSEIPADVPYLLIGGGTASFSAFRAIKSAEPEAKILVISNENNFPHMRPPLSKELWFSPDDSAVKDLKFKQWNGTERSLYYEPDDFYETCKSLMSNPKGGVAVAKGWVVQHIDVVGKKAYLDDGYAISYDKCLIATGSSPRNLDIFEKAPPALKERITLFREIFDFQDLHDIVSRSDSIAIIGGGFLGSELACALARKGKDVGLQVNQIFKETGNMGKILPEYLSLWTTEQVIKEGVNVIRQAEVTGIKLDNKKVQINLSNDKSVAVDHIVVAIGVAPNTALAEKSELEVDPELGGYLVNTELQARSNLYVAGDCSCFYDTKLGRRRVEHHDHAVVSGRLAGENMAGASKPYWHQSMFWSDLGPELGYEAIGIVDSSLPTVGIFAKATPQDNPQAVVTATNEGIRSATEELVSEECDTHIRSDPEQRKLLEKLQRDKNAENMGDDYGKGVIFYLRDDTVVGILLWNVFNRMNVARQVLKDERKYDDLNEVAKLFNIHQE